MIHSAICPPTVGISGRSGSGKTFLIERLVPRLMRRGLRVTVFKHCSHHIESDHPGKDSDRIYQSGADVLAAGPTEAFVRFHEHDMPLSLAMQRLTGTCDLCLVEGYRGANLPRILVAESEMTDGGISSSPSEKKRRVRKNDGDLAKGRILLNVSDVFAQTEAAEHFIWQIVEQSNRALPTLALILIGGHSRRMGHPKAMLELDGKSLLERVVSAVQPHVAQVFFGGAIPDLEPPIPSSVQKLLSTIDHLPDIPGVQGPLAGILSAMRWRPAVRWIVLACDLALIESRAVQWLISQTRPGIDAVFPRSDQSAEGEPLFAVYEPTGRARLEDAASQEIWALKNALTGNRVLNPIIPEELRPDWANINTPDDWIAAQASVARVNCL